MQAISSFPTLEEFKEFCSLEFENVSKSYSKDIFINPITLSMAEQCLRHDLPTRHYCMMS